MPIRFTPLVNDQFYHIFNRGVAKQPIFTDKKDYERLVLTLNYYHYAQLPFKLSRLLQLPQIDRNLQWKEIENNSNKIVEIVCYVLMPNHFHLLLRQISVDGISDYVSKTVNSYTKYFNTSKDRVGPLLQGPFKAVLIEDDEQLLHLSRYIHLNPLTSYVIKEKDFYKYPWSSFKDYLNNKKSFINKEIVLGQFSSPIDYKKFVMEQVDYAKEIETIKHLILE